MNIIRAANELKPGSRKVCLAIGMFDGVHLGHQQIIRQSIADARQHEAIALVVTFDRHPGTVVAPDRAPRLIYSSSQRLRAIESLGGDALLLIHFDRAFSHKRSGNVTLLKKLGEELQFIVHGLAAVSLDGQPVSSTRIREAIRSGSLDFASQMLGRPYSLAGRVIRGDQLGRQLGFPTANLDAAGLALPPNGIYAAHATVVGQATYQAVVNIGCRPTLQQPAPQLCVEAHLLDFTGNLYGEEIEVVFAEKLRDERKFPTTAELRDQIARDITEARSRF